MPEPAARLRGRRIVLPEHRELDRLAAMLEAEGASTVRCPLLAILDVEDPAPVAAWIDAVCDSGLDDVVFLTGEGVQRLTSAAERMGRKSDLVAALGRARKITRGPKPARALHQLGLAPDLTSTTPRSQGIIEALRGHVLARRRVGVQLYGDDPARELMEFLTTKGAILFPVAPYRYAPASDDTRVFVVLQEILAGDVDAIAFTTAAQVDRLLEVARRREILAPLESALARMHIAAVGPIVVERLRAAGLHVDSVPTQQFFMRRLTEAIATGLGPGPDG